MKTTGAILSLLSMPLFFHSPARASATHTAQVEIKLIQIEPKKDGKLDEDSVESMDGEFRLDWNTKKCEVKLKKQFVYCNLDTSTDIVNSKGELVMKALPQAHFEGSVLDALIVAMGLEDRKMKKIISKIVADTASMRAKGFDLPFYSCGDCEKNGKDLLLWNAYQSYIVRDLEIEHADLGNKKIVLRMKIKEMKAIKGAFNIIGNNNAAEYGH